MKHALTILAAMAIVGCGRSGSVATDAENTNSLPSVTTDSPSPTGAAPQNAVVTNTRAGRASTIPAVLHGRWGLTPGDCTSNRGDAKGLLVISGDELRFYESRAVPAANVQTSAGSVSGDFAFIGEGQQWTKYQVLQLQDGKLMRTERDPIGRFIYARCD